MKALITTFLLCGAAYASAQTLRWTTQPFFTCNLSHFSRGADGRWLAAGHGGNFYNSGSVTALSPSGQQLWQYVFNWQEQTEIKGLLPLPDGSVVITGNSNGCDYIVPGFVLCLDPDGQERWRYQPDVDPSAAHSFYSVGPVTLAPDSNLFVASADNIVKIDRQKGEFLGIYPVSKFNLPADMYYRADRDEFVIGGHNGITVFSPGQQTEQLIKPVTEGAGIIKVLPWADNRMLALTNTGVIEEVGPGGTFVHEWDFEVYDMLPYEDGLLLCGRDATTGIVRRVNGNFQVISGFEIGNPYLVPLRIQTHDMGIIVAGEEHDGPLPPRRPTEALPFPVMGNAHFWVQNYTWKGETWLPETSDAALTELVVHTPPKVFSNNDYSATLWGVKQGTFSVRLKNMGDEPLNTVNLNATGYGLIEYFGGVCLAPNAIFKSLSGMNLAPGADTLVYLGEIGTDNAVSVNPWKLCIWTSLPNGTPDRDHRNDYVCRDFDFTSSLSTMLLPPNALLPNPASGALYLQDFHFYPGRCRLFDAAGRLLSELEPVLEHSVYRFDVSRLPVGVYFLQTDLGWGKFVKM